MSETNEIKPMKKVFIQFGAYTELVIDIPKECEIGTKQFNEYAELALIQISNNTVPNWEILDNMYYDPWCEED